MPVGKIECLCAKFQLNGLVNRELLEERHIEVLKARTPYRICATTERRIIGLTGLRSHGRIGECRRVEPLRHVVFAPVDVASGHNVGIAVEPRGGGNGTEDGEWLPGLMGEDEICYPPADKGIGHAVDIVEEGF